MMKKCCAWHSKSAGLLVLRIGVGLIFIFSGWQKVSDLAGTVAFFGQAGFAPFWAYLVSYVELLGGIAVLLGVFMCIASALLTIIMAVAVYTLRENLQMAMTPIAVFFSTLALTIAGGGRYSLMKKCCGHGNSSGACCGKEGADKKCCDGGTCEAK